MDTFYSLAPFLSLLGFVILLQLPVVMGLVRLMEIPDEFFPGKRDKILWLVIFVVFNFLGALTFFFYLKRRNVDLM